MQNDLCSTQVNVRRPEVVSVIHKLQSELVDPVDIELEPHITVLYGLHSTEGVREAIAGSGPIVVTLGDLEIFETADADVLYIAVESDDLQRLNKKLQQLPYTNDYDEYIPHLTVAYLKKGTGKAGESGLAGTRIRFHQLYACEADRSKKAIAMSATNELDRIEAEMRKWVQDDPKRIIRSKFQVWVDSDNPNVDGDVVSVRTKIPKSKGFEYGTAEGYTDDADEAIARLKKKIKRKLKPNEINPALKASASDPTYPTQQYFIALPKDVSIRDAVSDVNVPAKPSKGGIVVTVKDDEQLQKTVARLAKVYGFKAKAVSASANDPTYLGYRFPSEKHASQFVDAVIKLAPGVLKPAYKGARAVVKNTGMYAADVADLARKHGGKPIHVSASNGDGTAVQAVFKGMNPKSIDQMIESAKKQGLSFKVVSVRGNASSPSGQTVTTKIVGQTASAFVRDNSGSQVKNISANQRSSTEDANGNPIEEGMKVKINPRYGGGKGAVTKVLNGFIVVNGKSYHGSDTTIMASNLQQRAKQVAQRNVWRNANRIAFSQLSIGDVFTSSGNSYRKVGPSTARQIGSNKRLTVKASTRVLSTKVKLACASNVACAMAPADVLAWKWLKPQLEKLDYSKWPDVDYRDEQKLFESAKTKFKVDGQALGDQLIKWRTVMLKSIKKASISCSDMHDLSVTMANPGRFIDAAIKLGCQCRHDGKKLSVKYPAAQASKVLALAARHQTMSAASPSVKLLRALQVTLGNDRQAVQRCMQIYNDSGSMTSLREHLKENYGDSVVAEFKRNLTAGVSASKRISAAKDGNWIIRMKDSAMAQKVAQILKRSVHRVDTSRADVILYNEAEAQEAFKILGELGFHPSQPKQDQPAARFALSTKVFTFPSSADAKAFRDRVIAKKLKAEWDGNMKVKVKTINDAEMRVAKSVLAN